MNDNDRFRIIADGWRRANPLWELMENAKLRSPKEVMDWVRYLQLPERHLTTREIIHPLQPVERP